MNWLLWTDIETTGLDIENDTILQIACALTDFKLIHEHIFPEFTFKCETKLSDWCETTHTQSGLMKLVEKSTTEIKEAEEYILNIINCYLTVKDQLYIAGNSVHFDKKFIDKHMPKLANRLSHRIVDVSSFSLVYAELHPEIHQNRPIKRHLHTAQSDIMESIEEYRYYTQNLKKLNKNRLN